MQQSVLQGVIKMDDVKYYRDSFSKYFKEELPFMLFVMEREENSKWITTKTKELSILAIEKRKEEVDKDGNPVVLLEDMKDYFINMEDVLNDTIQNTSLLLRIKDKFYPIRDCAIKTICERARISGASLRKIKKSVLAFIINECFKITGGQALLKVADNKVTTIHGGDPSEYAILSISELFLTVVEYLNENFSEYTFLEGFYSHTFATACWILPQNGLLFDVYTEELKKMNKPINHMRAVLRLSTSDTGNSAVTLSPYMLVGELKQKVPIGASLKLHHKNKVTMKDFSEMLQKIYAQYTKALNGLSKLLEIDINYPINTMEGIMKKLALPKRYCLLALEQFEKMNGILPCTAHDIYYGIAEVAFLAQAKGESADKIAELEEKIAGAITMNWEYYDVPRKSL